MKASFREQAVIFRRKHNWLVCWLYIGTFGSFIGYSFALPLVIKNTFPEFLANHSFIATYLAGLGFVGALLGSISRPFGGQTPIFAGGRGYAGRGKRIRVRVDRRVDTIACSPRRARQIHATRGCMWFVAQIISKDNGEAINSIIIQSDRIPGLGNPMHPTLDVHPIVDPRRFRIRGGVPKTISFC